MRQQVHKINIAHIADAIAMIERHDKRVIGIVGPTSLIEKVKKMGPYNAKTNQLWLLAVEIDDSLEEVFVHD